MEKQNILKSKTKLSLANLHWVHWIVVTLSLLLTFLAWHFTKSQAEEKVKLAFQKQSAQIIELVKERMTRYEDALWSGVAAIQLNKGQLSKKEWEVFAKNLSLEKKYPGISGIGVIYRVTPDRLPRFLKRIKKEDSAFEIYPPHDQNTYWPITYLEPQKSNRKAIGLDMAHEKNRFTAAKKARDTGSAQITGPIILVQDSEKTPGFLFYAPFYKENPSSKQKEFIGLVYAPFIVKNLMEGTLLKQSRQIGFSIKDGSQTIFDEHSPTFKDYDPNPLFKETLNIDLYGRTWTFDLWSAKSFRENAKNNQSWFILFGGLFIDTLLLLLFITLSKSNKRAIAYAEEMTSELKERTIDLERSNVELEQYAYVASHDLQAPVRHITAYSNFLNDELKEATPDKESIDKYLSIIITGTKKMSILIDDLLAFSGIGKQGLHVTRFKVLDLTSEITSLFSLQIEERKAQVTIDIDDIEINADKNKLSLIFQNLLSNALKYTPEDETPSIVIKMKSQPKEWHISVSDNGIGISPEFHEKVFKIFQRLHSDDDFKGTGIGLAVCKKIVELHGGKIWITNSTPKGSVFHFTIKKGIKQTRA